MSEENNRDDLEIGTIKVFFALKGYGFITREKGRDVFFFYKDVADEAHIYEGAKIAFNVEDNINGKGPRATNVKRIG
ncbi:retron Se72 family effector protein [Achromobacter denitrificans]|uniref:retron Se72 family effector protein n=1 Tax=Achromobacter denitrificans TaxID=32002 RepID=UPI0023E8D515|nr:retron Se72 family effector protein [Achromobacter denitrificans]MDF3861497.1 retron Se72 family effector protein [Achromobacter denitrificans]